MKKIKGKLLVCISLVIALLSNVTDSYACTGITLKAKDGSYIFGRTLEFAKPMDSDVIVIPKNYKFVGATTTGNNGLQWDGKFAAVGANFCGVDYIIDGVNEKGLSSGVFYFPGFAEYQAVTDADISKSIAPWQLVTWILTNFETVAEVKQKLKEIKVANVVFQKWDMVLPLHCIVTDPKGNSIVIEYIKGQLNIHDNVYGTITNAPPFDWMTLNIQNYLTLTPNNLPEITVAGQRLLAYGQGSGMFGVPGDFSPPSRFIRALFFSLASVVRDNSDGASMQAFHILNNFDIPEGVVRSSEGKITAYDITEWTSVHDLNKRNYYYKTKGDSRLRVVKLMNCNLHEKKIKKLVMDAPEDVLDVTTDLK